MKQPNIITAIDIGTSKICVLVGKSTYDSSCEIIGIGKAPSDGLSKGVVVDINKTVTSIKTALAQAELMAGHALKTAYIGISGSHITSYNSQGVVPIKRGHVSQSDIDNVIAAAKAIPLEKDQHILHVLPQYYIIDGRDKVTDPTGMHGVRLEAKVHIITGAVASVQNLIKCCEMAGIQVLDVILEPLASGRAVLSYDERMLGIGLLDIGGGTSDLAIYYQDSIRHTMVLPVAGTQFTHDLALGLRITMKEAERVKKEYASIALPAYGPQEIHVESVHGRTMRTITDHNILNILYPRAHEMLSLVHDNIIRSHMKSTMPSGLVLTGGGALLDGLPELAQEIFQLPVRVGIPHSQEVIKACLEHPMYATGYGLLLAGKEKQDTADKRVTGPLSLRVFHRMKSWVSEFF